MKKKHVYTDIKLWEGSSEHSRILINIVNAILNNYDFIANHNDGFYLPYDLYNKLTEAEKIQLYLIGEKYLIPIHIHGYNGSFEGSDFGYTLNEKGHLDR